MIDTTQRDLGRVQATQEIMQKDIEKIKDDLAEIKDSVTGKTAVSKSDYTRLGIVSVLASLATQLFTWWKPIA